MSKSALSVAGIIFGVVALVHLYRLYSHFSITIGVTPVPEWVSAIGAVVFGALSFWMFTSACPNCRK